MRFIYVRSMTFRSTSKLFPFSRLVFISLLFIADKMGNLSLKVHEPMEDAGSDADRFLPTPFQVGLACRAQFKLGSSKMGELELDPSRDCIDHNGISCLKVVDPIYKPSSGSASDGGREVFMVGQGEPPNQTVEVITKEAEEEIAWAAWLA
jgi:hypothetical protein